MAKCKLPRKLSKLLQVTFDDVKKVRRMKGYVLDMGTYHSGDEKPKCHVCLAGAVMVCSLNANRNSYTVPNYFGPEYQRQLYAIDHIRTGKIDYAFNRLHISYYGPKTSIYSKNFAKHGLGRCGVRQGTSVPGARLGVPSSRSARN